MPYLQRTLSLICLGLIPPLGPLDARTATSAALLGTLAAIAALVWLSVRTRSRVGLIAISGVVVVAATLAMILVGAHGPIARGVFAMAPLTWAAIAIVVSSHPSAASFFRSSARAAVAGAVVGVLLTAAGIKRFASRAEMWRRIADRDPGNEYAATATARARPKDARAVLLRCVESNPSACACARELAALPTAGDDKWIDTLAPECRAEPELARKLLDALVARGENEQVLRVTDTILARTPNDASALIARATAQWRMNDPNGALATARRAIGSDRNVDAHMLVGNILLAQKDLDGAANEFRAVIAANPNHAPSRYNLALIADTRNRYDEAREGYLAALRIQPTLADARYNLALLTRRFGAIAEAQHHVDQLAKIAPGDPRIGPLRKALQSQ